MLDIDPYTGRERTPSPGLALLRQIGTSRAGRRVRAGLAQTQMLILLGVIAAIIVLGIGGFAIYRSVTSGSQDTATKQNIDRVALALENYWQQFVADRYGVSDIDLLEACNYLNSQFTQQEDLRIRTLAVTDTAPLVVGTDTDAAAVATGLAQTVRINTDAGTLATKAQANCPTGFAGIDKATAADIIVGDAAAAALTTLTATGTNGEIDWAHAVHAIGAGDGPSLDNFAALGLSQQSVWIMQPNGLAVANRPAGTDVPAAAADTEAALTANEMLIIGGVSPSGNSYCLIKVFNAGNRTHIGDYRFAHTYDGGVPRMAICTQGTNGTPPTGMTRNAGWPG